MKNLPGQSSAGSDEASLAKTLDLIGRLIEKIERQLESADSKASIGDYIKLLQLQKDLEDKKTRRIEVKWVDNL